MGASQEKKKRQDMKAAGTDKRQERQEKLEKDRKRSRRNTTIIGSIVALVLIGVIILNSSLFYTGLTAVSAGDWKYKTADFNYYYFSAYQSTYNSLYQSYGESVSMLLDSKKPLKEQQYDDTKSWADYFEEVALKNMQETAILCDAAKDAGFSLTQEDHDSIDSTIENLSNNYASYGYSSLAAFLTGVYGKGTTEDNFRKNLENDYLANRYVQDMIEKMDYTDEQLNAYYNEHKDEYDLITYRRYYISGDADEENNIDSETAMANAKKTADAIAKAKNEQDFNDLVYQNAPEDKKETYADGAGTIYKNQSASNLLDAYKEWLLDEKRAEGDITTIEASSGYYVLYYISRSDNSYNTINVRHILISADSSADEETVQAAKEKAETLLQTWQSAEATEDSFAELAKENSSDGSASNGGLYENVYLGQMVTEFEDWCFDDSRKPGDTGIVKTRYGFHVMYFVGEGDIYREMLAKDAKQNEDYKNWLEEKRPNYEITKKFAMTFAK